MFNARTRIWIQFTVKARMAVNEKYEAWFFNSGNYLFTTDTK